MPVFFIISGVQYVTEKGLPPLTAFEISNPINESFNRRMFHPLSSTYNNMPLSYEQTCIEFKAEGLELKFQRKSFNRVAAVQKQFNDIETDNNSDIMDLFDKEVCAELTKLSALFSSSSNNLRKTDDDLQRFKDGTKEYKKNIKKVNNNIDKSKQIFVNKRFCKQIPILTTEEPNFQKLLPFKTDISIREFFKANPENPYWLAIYLKRNYQGRKLLSDGICKVLHKSYRVSHGWNSISSHFQPVFPLYKDFFLNLLKQDSWVKQKIATDPKYVTKRLNRVFYDSRQY